MSEDDPVLRYRVTASNIIDLRAYLKDAQPDYGCRPFATRGDEGEVSTTVFLAPGDRERSRSVHPSVRFEEIEDPLTSRAARSLDVGDGNRFARSDSIPRGVGRKG